MDTIFALATARGKSGVAVIRISGPKAFDAVTLLCELPKESRRATLRRLTWDGVLLDEALVLSFPAPNSFTGDDVVELHTHGSIASTSAILKVLADINGLRLAEPGEFTRRALENEKLDLAQVEGLADLIAAETEAQRRQAQRVLSGELGSRAESWRSQLISAASLIEATIDFADEDVPVDVVPEIRSLVQGARQEIETEILRYAVAERIRDGFEVAIVGPPNVGKSTLLNVLAGRDAAITSEKAGTTRDVIEVYMDLRGLPVTFLDTAGVRSTEDEIELLGIERALTRASTADLRIVLLECQGAEPVLALESGDIAVVTKSDLQDGGDISAISGQGIEKLVERVTDVISARAAGVGVTIRERHRIALVSSIEYLESVEDRLKTTPEHAELIAEDLRGAIRALESLVGRVDVEHLLDEIFSSFCIGK
ncbi:MAG: tRNA uridine-5-carboxymethylaminomethyl(34) synthesis GTPase MnmE [Boseongicola sp.]